MGIRRAQLRHRHPRRGHPMLKPLRINHHQPDPMRTRHGIQPSRRSIGFLHLEGLIRPQPHQVQYIRIRRAPKTHQAQIVHRHRPAIKLMGETRQLRLLLINAKRRRGYADLPMQIKHRQRSHQQQHRSRNPHCRHQRFRPHIWRGHQQIRPAPRPQIGVRPPQPSRQLQPECRQHYYQQKRGAIHLISVEPPKRPQKHLNDSHHHSPAQHDQAAPRPPASPSQTTRRNCK